MGPTKRQPQTDTDPRPPGGRRSRLSELPAAVGKLLPLSEASFCGQLQRVIEFSDYAADVVRREAAWLADAWQQGDLERPFDAARLTATLAGALALALDAAAGEEQAMAVLRRHRHRQLLAIVWRDLNGRADLPETLQALSGLAEVLIEAALNGAETELKRRYGTPRGADGEALRPVILGMGKLGGCELNFSSDVDLVFAYREAGSCDGPRSLSNEEYFARLVRALVRWLGERTAEGFVYRVDLRLRPFGDAGRPALSFASMEQYYQRDGRDWERYALVKARPVAGDRAAGAELLKTLRPFVYRRYLDYSAFDALREMKAMIRAEVKRRDLAEDIKLGPGGIREIEFTAQAFQLVRGGQEPSLRDTRLRPVLARLGELGLLEVGTAAALDRAYCFLRTLENRVQQLADRQTHRLPADAARRERIYKSLGYANLAALRNDLDGHRRVVGEAFRSVFARPQAEAADRWRDIWDASAEADDAGASLTEAGFADPQSGRRVAQFRRGAVYRGLGERARRRIDRLLPRVLEAAAGGPYPDRVLRRLLGIVAQIAARSAYVALLCERPPVLAQLVHVCRRSSWISSLIAAQPALLDELIDHSPASRADFEGLLRARLESAEDPEAEMNVLRKCHQAEALSIAVARSNESLQPPAVARRLSDLADAVLAATQRLAWRDLVARHGAPPGSPGLAIIGYGTLGGRELNFESDLDLVFLFRDGEPGGDGEALTDGTRPIGSLAFFSRLCQRMLHALTAQMAGGRLYRVDTRLRPNGKAGFLVSSLDAFAAYQRERAWTWELQALSRARWVAGDEAIRAPFEALRRELLQRRREPAALAAEVVEMREKMRAHLDRSDAHTWDLKHGAGGKVDIEFIAQFARLAWSRQHPALAEDSGTGETLTRLAETSLMPAADVAALLSAYRAYQGIAQQNTLQGRPETVVGKRCRQEAAAVTEVWSRLFGC